jgi:anhydro-N-acetylmuramic acid kinase
MNDTISHLSKVAAKDQKLIIGLMSGTSLDGLDIALCEIRGVGRKTEVKLRAFKTVPYSRQVIQKLKKVVSVEEASLQEVCLLHSWLGDYHGGLIIEALQEWEMEPAEIDCIASHGQSIYHAPITHHQQKGMPNATLQIGDGDHIARKTGILTVSDFRQKHTAAGGEGAPLVALTDEMLYADEQKSRLLLNIGGIANFTYLPAADEQQKPITTDIGPGNTLIDQVVQQLFNKSYDKDGSIAAKGTVHPGLLKKLLNDAFFSLPKPRTTGPELFNMAWLQKHQQEAEIGEIADEDIVATVTWLSAQSIVDAILEVVDNVDLEIYLSGGGMHNKQLVKWMEELLGQPTHSFQEIGFSPDAKEAVCFAVLANELLSGEAFSINPKQNSGRRVNLGKISLPV